MAGPRTIGKRVGRGRPCSPFIGSNATLVAPVRVGRGAYVAAGSAVTDDVPPGALGIARARQVNKDGWADSRRAAAAARAAKNRRE